MHQRQDVDILHALFMELARIRFGDPADWAKVSNSHKVKSYFPGGAAAVAAFANVLNQCDPMNTDNILVHPQDIRNAKTIGNIYGALLAAYENGGWTITA